jgi:hypothetical protein
MLVKLRKALMFSIAVLAQASLAYGEAVKAISVSFPEGSAKLQEEDKGQIRDLVQDGLKRGKIDHVTVAAWSDRGFPDEKKTLSELDKSLAEERAAVIADYLKQGLEVTEVVTFNMAERPHWLSLALQTRDAELKSTFARNEAEIKFRRPEFREIRRQGGPSLAVVVLSQEESANGLR